jgi:hypothetical protein
VTIARVRTWAPADSAVEVSRFAYAGPLIKGVHVAHAVTEMITVARNSTRYLFPVQDQHPAAMRSGQPRPGQKAGRSGADDGYLRGDFGACNRCHPTTSLE